MRTEDYPCGICDATFGSPEEALKCRELGFNPLYEIGDKLFYNSISINGIVTIVERQIVRWTHVFIYKLSMLAEDNPEGPLHIDIWKYESDLLLYVSSQPASASKTQDCTRNE